MHENAESEMNMAKKKITDIVEEMLDGFLNDEGYELYDCQFVKEGRDWIPQSICG